MLAGAVARHPSGLPVRACTVVHWMLHALTPKCAVGPQAWHPAFSNSEVPISSLIATLACKLTHCVCKGIVPAHERTPCNLTCAVRACTIVSATSKECTYFWPCSAVCCGSAERCFPLLSQLRPGLLQIPIACKLRGACIRRCADVH